jgi:hypothetical protein
LPKNSRSQTLEKKLETEITRLEMKKERLKKKKRKKVDLREWLEKLRMIYSNARNRIFLSLLFFINEQD